MEWEKKQTSKPDLPLQSLYLENFWWSTKIHLIQEIFKLLSREELYYDQNLVSILIVMSADILMYQNLWLYPCKTLSTVVCILCLLWICLVHIPLCYFSLHLCSTTDLWKSYYFCKISSCEFRVIYCTKRTVPISSKISFTLCLITWNFPMTLEVTKCM